MPEPLGGAHRDFDALADALREALQTSLREVRSLSINKLLEKRYEKLMALGKFKE